MLSEAKYLSALFPKSTERDSSSQTGCPLGRGMTDALFSARFVMGFEKIVI